MIYKWNKSVSMTRMELRKKTLETVLTQFDCEVMGLNQQAREEKYKKMGENPFRFFRGSAYLFYYDMTHIPLPFHNKEQRPVWIQGDLHFENFGAFQNEKGEIVFDVNDFDEGYPGSYLFDLLRMTVSILLFCRQNQIQQSIQEEAVLNYLKFYRKQLKDVLKKKMNPLSLRFSADYCSGPIKKMLRKLEKKERHDFLQRITEGESCKDRRFIKNEEMMPVPEMERLLIESSWESYLHSIPAEFRKEESYYRIKDIILKKGSGTASIGLNRYYILIAGDQETLNDDDIILEVKEVRSPIPAYFLPYNHEFLGQVSHQGKRVMMTQQAMHHAPDPFLGYLTIGEKEYYVRERSPFKKKVKGKSLKSKEDVIATVSIMGKITAKMHARADIDHVDWFGYQSEGEILQAMGSDKDFFYQQILTWSLFYAQQVEGDYQLFTQWVPQSNNN